MRFFLFLRIRNVLICKYKNLKLVMLELKNWRQQIAYELTFRLVSFMTKHIILHVLECSLETGFQRRFFYLPEKILIPCWHRLPLLSRLVKFMSFGNVFIPLPLSLFYKFYLSTIFHWCLISQFFSLFVLVFLYFSS